MGRIWTAIVVFFKVLFNGAFAQRVRVLMDGAPAGVQSVLPGKATPAITRPAPAAPPPPVRSEAITLLSVLQREARLLDFLKEDIGPYSDAQVGAAVRDVHRDAAAALERLLAPRPVVEQPEGSEITLPSGYDAAKYRLVGNVGSAGPTKGKVQHAGWQATKLELPQYSGSVDAAMIVAPAEVEV